MNIRSSWDSPGLLTTTMENPGAYREPRIVGLSIFEFVSTVVLTAEYGVIEVD